MTEQNKRVNKKTLKLSSLEKKFKEQTTMLTHVIDFDTKESVKYYPVFPETKIDELIQDLFDTLTHAEENNIDFLKNDYEIVNYAMYLMVKHFTHFKDEISDDFDVNIAAMRLLYDSGIYALLHEELFDTNQVYRVLDKIHSITEKGFVAKDIEDKERKKIKNMVTNKEIIGEGIA